MAKTTFGGDSVGSVWDHLYPNAQGSYVGGSWTTEIPAMYDTRTDFSSQLLRDGRLYVAGGEYGTGGSAGEIYDPLTNLWTRTPAPGAKVGDACSEILPDGKVLQSLTGTGTHTVIWDPASNTYAPGPSTLGNFDEAAWVKLPDQSILQVDFNSRNSERYIPAQNQWVTDAQVPVSLYDPYGTESGAALLLPNGKAFFLGSPGTTAIYTPSGNASPGTWAAGPAIPDNQGTPDAPAAMMVNGKILCAVSPIPTTANHFPPPISYYEYDDVANAFTRVSAPGGGMTRNAGSYVANMLALPNGQILYSEQGIRNYYVYTPDGSTLAAGKPAITRIDHGGSDCNSGYTITGTQFNGISEGAAYGDDEQMNTNYPILRLTSGSDVYYARTFNWNSTGVQRGSEPDTAAFTLPSDLPMQTAYSLVVSANGIASDPVDFTPCAPTLLAAHAMQAGLQGFSIRAVGSTLQLRFQWNASGPTRMRLATLDGRILYQENFAGSGLYTRSLDRSRWEKGVYVFAVSDARSQISRRLVIP